MPSLNKFKIGDVIQCSGYEEQWLVTEKGYTCIHGPDEGKRTGCQPDRSYLMLLDSPNWRIAKDPFDEYVEHIKARRKQPRNAELRRFLAKTRWERRR